MLIEVLTDFLFPPRCLSCRDYVERRGAWCTDCAQRLCGLHRIVQLRGMTACSAGIWAFGYYREGVRDLVRALKYQGKKEVLPYLHAMLAAGDEVFEQLPKPLIAVPVPLARERERLRGFNQVAEIFGPWLARHSVPLVPLLCRTRETAPLYERTRAERRKELRGAFSLCAEADIGGRDILLVDDIMTTGTTLEECARMLRHAGAGRVYAFVLASEHM